MKHKETLTMKQQKLLEELPKNSYNMTRSAIKAGYKENYARTKLHSDVRKSKLLERYFSEDSVKKRIRRAEKKFLKDSDNSNLARMLELQSKILGLTKDQSQNVSIIVDMTKEALALRSKYMDMEGLHQ